jgi:signal transduction histidine kinase/phage shock protein PspC (stress-responsive transcriptional regulator)
MVAGVAAGLAEHLAVSVLAVRVALVVGVGLGGAGVLAYGLLWRLLPQEAPQAEGAAPGLDAATRQGRRTGASPAGGVRRRGDSGQAVALGVVGLGVVLLSARAGSFGAFVVPVLAGAAGIALVWWQADQVQRARWTDRSPGLPVLGLVLGADTRGALTRLVLGGALVVAAISVLVAQSAGWSLLDDVVIALLLALAGVALLLGPWVTRLVRELGAERSERVRAQERADVAAHLHDSVLQTLALLQRHAGDERTVATLARKQERELRAWLFGAQERTAAPDGSPATLASALAGAVAEVEEEQAVPVELVVVADSPLDRDVQALVRATREAVLNAAQHSGADRVDVYAEVQRTQIEVFVRDRGCGFDPEAVPLERLGLRGSVRDRMRRHGGEATVRSSAGEGTEIRLVLPRPVDQNEGASR